MKNKTSSGVAAFYASILAMLLLPGCITSYQSPNGTIPNCSEFVESSFFKKRELKYDADELAAIQKIPWEVQDYEAEPPKSPIIIRYSDGGELVNRCDYSAALYAARSTLNEPSVPTVFVVYVHGWRIDSGPRNKLWYNFPDHVPQDALTAQEPQGGDLESFDAFLGELREKMGTRERSEQKPNVVGIFVSWKGGTKIPVLDYLSFWNRGAGADRLSRSGQLSRLFGALENIKKPNDQIIYIGHSFGARILYSTVADRLTYDVQQAYNDEANTYDLITRNRDLVLLINPAMEAAPNKTIDEFRFANTFHADQAPLMMLLQSQTDWPNQSLFPLGNALALRLSKAERQSAGFWKPFRTHALRNIEESQVASSARDEDSPWYDGLCIQRYCLDRDDDWSGLPAKNSPFLVVDVPASLLHLHGWFQVGERNRYFSDWLARFLDRHNCEVENAVDCDTAERWQLIR